MALAVAAGGCKTKPVEIRYQQVLNFHVFDPNPSATPHTTYGAGTGRHYILYKITSIMNPEGNPTFHFDPKRIYAGNNDVSNKAFNFSWNYHLLTESWPAQPVSVAGGTTKSGGIGCIVAKSPGGMEDTEHINPLYAAEGNDVVLMLKNQDHPPVQYVGTAYPHTLENQCSP